MSNPIKLLYVDDEEINLFLFKNFFKKKFEVITASSGPDALKELEQNSAIEIVISDFKMPEMDGIDFITQAHEKHQDKHFYILTGYDVMPKITEAINTGLVLKKFAKPLQYEIIEEEILDKLNS